jgi:hypothetical protein
VVIGVTEVSEVRVKVRIDKPMAANESVRAKFTEDIFCIQGFLSLRIYAPNIFMDFLIFSV